MANSKPRQFAHRRTVRLIADDDTTDIDALKIAQSLPQFAGEIKGIVPLYGGKCFDITLASPEAAAKLAQEGIDYEQKHKSLRLLGRRSIHVSIFVSVEYPDEELLNLLATYGELKSRTVRRLYFTEEGYTHIENGVRVVEFTKIDRDIPKRVFAGGLEMGFKYSGQPVTCYRCHSTEHVVRDCPKRRKPTDRGGVIPDPPRNELPSAEEPAEHMDQSATPVLFTDPQPSYGEAADNTADNTTDPRKTSGNNKRPPPSPSGSDDERESSKKRSMENPSASTANTATPSNTSTNKETAESPIGLRNFTQALESSGPQRQLFMKHAHSTTFYKCRALYLHHRHGPITDALAKKIRVNEHERKNWEALRDTIRQDAYAELLISLRDVQQNLGIFTSDV